MAELPKGYPEPTMCDLCGRKLEDEETYYIGYTRGNIWANTCYRFDCKQWLIQKAKFKKPWRGEDK